MALRTCEPKDSQAQALIAKDSGYKRSFAPVTVKIERVDKAKGEIEFTPKNASKTTTIPWKESHVWVNCPTTAAGPGGALPDQGIDGGVLYLSASVYQSLEPSAQQYARVKWPEEEQGDSPDTTLDLNIRQIVVTYRPKGANTSATVTLTPSGAISELDLRNVYATLPVAQPGGGTEYIPAVVLKAELTATDPESGITNTVDLMSWALADSFQVVKLHAKPVAIRLSATGASRFGQGAPPSLGRQGQGHVILRAAATPAGSGRCGGRQRMTFLAKPATGSSNVAPVPTDGNIAIESVKQLLDASGTEYETVSSLREIAASLSRLENDHRRPYEIQIIGHGAPGMLSLGYYWNPKRYTDDGHGPYYLLDSNPYAYGLLDAWVHPETRVILVGCNVGSNHNSRAVARGSSLIFDLHAMWGCDVLAADDLVGPDHFIDGRFEGSVQGYVRGRWVQAKSRRRSSPRVASKDETFSYRDVKLSGVPALGANNDRSDQMTIDPAPLQQYIRKLDCDAPLLAMNEVSFIGKGNDGTNVELHLICNGEYLKVVRPGPSPTELDVRIFATKDPQHDTLDRLVDRRCHPSQQIWTQIKGELGRIIASSL